MLKKFKLSNYLISILKLFNFEKKLKFLKINKKTLGSTSQWLNKY